VDWGEVEWLDALFMRILAKRAILEQINPVPGAVVQAGRYLGLFWPLEKPVPGHKGKAILRAWTKRFHDYLGKDVEVSDSLVPWWLPGLTRCIDVYAADVRLIHPLSGEPYQALTIN
jgi:hypothetical protein